MHKLFLVLLFAFLAGLGSVSAAECPEELEPGCSCVTLDSKCYCICALLKNWTTADDYCQSNNFTLVSFEGEAENFVVAEYMLRAGYSRGVPFFTSGKRDSDQEPWVWTSTGESFGYTNWIPGFGGGPSCVVLSLPDDGQWFPADCKSNYYFVCEQQTSE